MKNLDFNVCNDRELWDNFVKLSPQGSIFCTTSFLNSLGVDYKLYFVEYNNTPRLGAVILLDDHGEPINAPFPFSLYQGVLLDEKLSCMQVNARVTEALRLTQYLLENLECKYKRISFCMHPDIEDLRGFSWFNYHEPESGQFNIKLLYTGIINLSEFDGFEKYLETIRKSRRYEYRKAIKDNLVRESSTDIEILLNLYKLTFERQDIDVSESKILLVRNISLAAINQGYGELSLCKDQEGTILSATLFLHDDKCSYYLIGANHPDYRNTGSGVFLVLENVRNYLNRGYKYVDVCGLNSPNRGDFKSSLNAKPVPYYITTWDAVSGSMN